MQYAVLRLLFYLVRVYLVPDAAAVVVVVVFVVVVLTLTLLGLQSRFGDNWGQITWNLTALSPHRDWSSKGVNSSPQYNAVRGRRAGSNNSGVEEYPSG